MVFLGERGDLNTYTNSQSKRVEIGEYNKKASKRRPLVQYNIM